MQNEQPNSQLAKAANPNAHLLQQQRQYQQAINAIGHERLNANQKCSLVFYTLEHITPNYVPLHPLKQQLLSALLGAFQEEKMAFQDTVYTLSSQVVHNTNYLRLLMQQPQFDTQQANEVLASTESLVALAELFNTFIHYDLDIFSTGLFTK